ncbi:bifunctional ADP-dependent NAD(P)H-hydrate dehydratase/NAD(P)H-hydrate epimerase [Thalassovita gelatinovora]|nr:bifunctional ADP-dependent NAD(P)H-hydrate dehydratase/NAD(P)H-hydrate epimerase [Thalassovita gelatinovora]QIZ82424.1 bifunctional ADP-dependent NAD(P)H-hydrate dehydratase/NAD(P)H-hydrate epimerase [Thalassovita gelatinovora]
MTELLSAAQMRAIEQAAIESGEVTGLELMERAGQGVVEAIFAEWPELAVSPAAGGEGGVAPRPAGPDSPQDICEQKKLRAVVLCGPGNNGGDGFVVARLLKERGWEVEVFLYGDAGKLPPDAKANYERWLEMGEVTEYDGEFWMDPSIYREDSVLVDALFGTGLTRPVENFNAFGWVTQLTEWRLSPENRGAAYPAPRVVSVDMPSGVCADSGRRLYSADPPFDLEEISADLTVTFHSKKLGHVLAVGPYYSGKVVVQDIGLCEDHEWRKANWKQIAKQFDAPFVGLLAKGYGGHKYSHGHALILSGRPGRTGAARMAARGALRIGAGLVTLAVPPAAQAEVAAQVTAIMLRRVGDATALTKVLEDARFNAIGLGPALGLDAGAAALVAAALEAGRASVLDADALTLLAQDAALFSKLHENCVLTPHAGEFRRLFPDIAAKLETAPVQGPAYSKVDAVREAAKRAGCVVLFKGPDTVIAAPDGRCSINSAQYERAAPWLATAGSGDVLTGFIAGLLARGFAPQSAAETAAWLHVECALEFGPGLMAEDLSEQLPKVFRRLLSQP